MADGKRILHSIPESVFQLVFCIYVQMIGRLVQKKNVGVTVHQLAKTHFCLLTTA